MSVQNRGGRRTPPGDDQASKISVARRRLVNTTRRSQHKPDVRRSNVLTITRGAGNAYRSRRHHHRGRRGSAAWDLTSSPLHLPITSNELEAVERLLGRELRLLLQRT